MSEKMSQSNDQPPSQHGSQDNRPDAPDLLFRPPLPTDDGWEYYRRGPQLLASIGNWSWIRRASRERLARQHKGQDGEYIHHWWIKDQCSPKTPAIAEDAQALANTWGKELHRSADEPETEPVFSPDEIRCCVSRPRWPVARAQDPGPIAFTRDEVPAAPAAGSSRSPQPSESGAPRTVLHSPSPG